MSTVIRFTPIEIIRKLAKERCGMGWAYRNCSKLGLKRKRWCPACMAKDYLKEPK